MAGNKVLFVDDEPSIREVIKSVLSRQGFDVIIAEGPGMALDILKKEPIPLVLTDLMMPEIDGVKLCEQIKAIMPDTLVIALSAYIDSDYLTEKLDKAGFDGWLVKPIKADRLTNAVQGAFDRIKRKKNA